MLSVAALDLRGVHHGMYPRDITTHLAQFVSLVGLLSGELHPQAELGAQQLLELLLELAHRLGSEFGGFHIITPQNVE